MIYHPAAEYITKMHISIEMYLILDPPVSLALKGTESLKNTNIKQRLVSPYSRRCTESTARGGPASQISCRIASTRVSHLIATPISAVPDC